MKEPQKAFAQAVIACDEAQVMTSERTTFGKFIKLIINQCVLSSFAGAKSLMKWNEYNYHAQFMVE